jgi:hypothetical protein
MQRFHDIGANRDSRCVPITCIPDQSRVSLPTQLRQHFEGTGVLRKFLVD